MQADLLNSDVVSESFEDRLAARMKKMGWNFTHSKDAKKINPEQSTNKTMNINEFLNE